MAMKVPSNRLSDIIGYYRQQLAVRYDFREADAIVSAIVEHFLGVGRLRLALEPNLRVSESEMLEVHFAVKEVLKGKPLQYVTGIGWFDGKAFTVNESVLIPRPETEGLLAFADDFISRKPDARLLDACTGSGCLAISLKLRHPKCSVVATDVSMKALQVAALNAAKLGAQITFLNEDLFSGSADAGRRFDIILSNPPYIPENERKTLSDHVLAEPSEALFVPDNDPLVFYRALAHIALNQLTAGGFIAVECHSNYVYGVASLFSENGLAGISIKDDFHGRKRFVLATKN